MNVKLVKWTQENKHELIKICNEVDAISLYRGIGGLVVGNGI